ncbi:hypothetical protein EUBDOL_00465 [Amedibacillus dolichus DSM 3991]|uniref:Uncharacterized protein n=1 Tax=Amedibacillus dolichus DSM 3991 TaxID=428127 RepID=A8R929_9FIRM|nr:hypothetical protein EUBDOL_00465 [Amedibacillus dolichus DSM 3991]
MLGLLYILFYKNVNEKSSAPLHIYAIFVELLFYKSQKNFFFMHH